MAVGETLRRLVGKVLLSTPSAKEQTVTLRPVQCGVAVPNATESIAMSVQSLANTLGNGSNWACLQVDFTNAFNCLDRSAILSAAALRTPTCFNYLRFAYGTPAPLYIGGQTLFSLTGTHQGCPLGPLGFALGLQDVLEDLQSRAGLL